MFWPLLLAKLCRETSALISKSYMAAGQTCAALHTMGAYEADMKEMDEHSGLADEAIKKLLTWCC